MKLLKPRYLLIVLFLIFACKKEDVLNNDSGPQIVLDNYSFTKVHNDWSVDMQGHTTSSTTTTGPFVISLPPIDKSSVIVFEGDSLSYFMFEQPDTSRWLFTPGGFYTPSPYNGSQLEYFPSKDSIHYLKWYGGSHTSSHSDNYYGKKIN